MKKHQRHHCEKFLCSPLRLKTIPESQNLFTIGRKWHPDFTAWLTVFICVTSDLCCSFPSRELYSYGLCLSFKQVHLSY